MSSIDTFTAELNGTGTAFEVTITTTGFDTFTLTRSALGSATVVRGCDDTPLTAGAAFVLDLEAPQNTDVTYVLVCVRTSDGHRQTATIAATGQIDFGHDGLFDLSRASVVLNVHPEVMPTIAQEIPSDVVWAQNRVDPVVVSQVLRMPSLQLSLVTATLTEKAALDTTLARGNIIAFSPRYPADYGFDGLLYLAVIKVQTAPLNPRKAAEPGRRYLLDAQRIAPPPASFIPISGRTWGDVDVLGWTWDHPVVTGMTWLDMVFA